MFDDLDDMGIEIDDSPLLPPGFLEALESNVDGGEGGDGGEGAAIRRPLGIPVPTSSATPAAGTLAAVPAVDMAQYMSKEQHENELRALEEKYEEKYKAAAAQPLGDWREKSTFLKTQAPDAYNDVVNMIEAAVNTRLAEIEPLKKGLDKVQAASAAQSMQQLVTATNKHLAAYGVKDFDVMSLNSDPNFEKFADLENPDSGLTYRQILQNAKAKGKPDIAAKVFATYLRQSNADARDVNNYIGIKGSVKTDVPSPEDSKIYTEKQVKDFYRNKGAGKFSRNANDLKWAAEEEKRIAKAYNEGRIVSG
ncbi:MAG: hypothetical protein HQK95_09030 [Nitrospirae bacterium]|nr:hypothetical protein [Nitrospirota bacterium]